MDRLAPTAMGNGARGGCQHKSHDQESANSVEHEVGIDVEFEIEQAWDKLGGEIEKMHDWEKNL